MIASRSMPPSGDPEAKVPPTDTPMQAEITLLAFPHAAALAREFARSILQQVGAEEVSDTVQLVTSELVTNVIDVANLTAATPVADIGAQHMFKLCLFTDATNVTVAVWDALPGRPVQQAPDEEAINGRGLVMVEALSHEWGCTPCPQNSKVVWAMLRRREPSP